MDQTTTATYSTSRIAVLLAILAFAVITCVSSNAPKRGVQNRQARSIQSDIPRDLSIVRGNLQRTGVFPNGGTPSLQGDLWQKWQRDYVDSAPIMAGDMLIVAVPKEGLYGLDAKTGEIKWRKPGDVYSLGEPAYRDGTLYYWWDDGLHALDMTSQQEKWVFTGTHGFEAYSDYLSSPAVGNSTLYLNAARKLQAIDRSTGQARWAARFADFITSYVALDGNSAYFTAAYDRTQPGSDLLDFQVNLYAADARTGQELWKFEPQGNQEIAGSVGDPIVGDGVVYCATRDDAWIGPGRVYAFDGETGEILWERPIDDQAENLTHPDLLAYSNGLLYLATDASSYYGGDATLYAFDGKTGQVRWSFIKGDFMSAPTISGQTIYITAGHNKGHTGDTLYALASSTGKLLRQVQLWGAVTRPLVIDHGTIYYASQDIGYLVAAIR